MEHGAPAPPPPAETARRRPKTALPARAPGRVWAGAGALGLAAAVAAYLVMPGKPPAEPGGAEFDGDPVLADSVAASVDGREDRVQGLSVLEIDGEETRTLVGGTTGAGEAVSEETRFETGSVFKVVTAMTLADLAESGGTSPDRTLGEVFGDLDFASPATAEITLEELASHRSGLPRIPAEATAAGVATPFTVTDPYRGMPPVEESLAAAVPAQGEPEWSYSNFGYAVLGAALAEESGTAYPRLVRERIFDPLGMDDTVMRGAGIDGLPDDAAPPHAVPGKRTEPWRSQDYLPVGIGTWTTAGDLERFLRAVMDGTAPGAAAAEPAHRGPAPESRIGLGWITTDFGDGVEVVQHGGGTYGSTAFIGFQGERGVIVLSNSFAADAAVIGPRLMGAPDVPPLSASPATSPVWGLAATLPLVLPPPLLALSLMLRRRTLVGQRPLDRLRVVSMTAGTAAVLAAALVTGDWVAAPPVVWAASAGAVVAAAAVGAWRWPRAAVEAGRWRWLHVAFFCLSASVSAAVALTAADALLAAYG
ncbi:serine hydrolase domain-containing protein [Streptomonospora salina]|uniref:CubicO group peptidase (Beta-lactamase class C family) n=1 Tax=Streptomonospora salina TaxID=104205 RepID=A0A841E6V9_9ACTN|nr:serine hydrolase domain-containing protein [Streptomonospora salina]MBB5999667.1 CubicO group peptidase (beta-lactamase class C family) [Streptomonospora salina]